MPTRHTKETGFSRDAREFLILLLHHKVRYLIVGGEAVIYYGYARLTGDIDIFYSCSKPNALRLFKALSAFWSGSVPGVGAAEELMEPGVIVQFGRPPFRIDLINKINGVMFAKAWRAREDVTFTAEGCPIQIHYIGLEDLVRNKACTARPKDLDDLQYLKRRALKQR